MQLNQARLYVHIMDVSKHRFEQEYFRIGCYGLGFHDFLQVRQRSLEGVVKRRSDSDRTTCSCTDQSQVNDWVTCERSCRPSFHTQLSLIPRLILRRVIGAVPRNVRPTLYTPTSLIRHRPPIVVQVQIVQPISDETIRFGNRAIPEAIVR